MAIVAYTQSQRPSIATVSHPSLEMTQTAEHVQTISMDDPFFKEFERGTLEYKRSSLSTKRLADQLELEAIQKNMDSGRSASISLASDSIEAAIQANQDNAVRRRSLRCRKICCTSCTVAAIVTTTVLILTKKIPWLSS